MVRVFQSTPVITDGRTLQVLAMISLRLLFQSTPVITDGRTSHSQHRHPAQAGFNPRPSSLTGEPVTDRERMAALAVSIHARHH